jgi:hypothetical protein
MDGMIGLLALKRVDRQLEDGRLLSPSQVDIDRCQEWHH